MFIEKEFSSQIAGAKAEMQKLFRQEGEREGQDKENAGMAVGDSVDVSQVNGGSGDGVEKSVPPTPSKVMGDESEMASHLKENREAESKLEEY